MSLLTWIWGKEVGNNKKSKKYRSLTFRKTLDKIKLIADRAFTSEEKNSLIAVTVKARKEKRRRLKTSARKS